MADVPEKLNELLESSDEETDTAEGSSIPNSSSIADLLADDDDGDAPERDSVTERAEVGVFVSAPVSYTHLTLPTKA